MLGVIEPWFKNFEEEEGKPELNVMKDCTACRLANGDPALVIATAQ